MADAVGASEIATDAVGAAEILADAVTASEIATDAVGSAEIATDAVTASEIAADAVGASEIATDAVGSAEIATDAVGAAEVTDGSLRAADIGVISGSVNINPANVGANSCNTVTAGVTGIQVGDKVILNAPSALSGNLIAMAVQQPTADTLTFRLCNVQGLGGVDAPSQSWSYIVTR